MLVPRTAPPEVVPKFDPTGTTKPSSKPKETTVKTNTVVRNDVPADRSGDGAANGDPLAGIRLVIVLKNGKRIEKPMSDVLKFSLDKTGYTLIFKDGNIIRYQIANVSRVSIE